MLKRSKVIESLAIFTGIPTNVLDGLSDKELSKLYYERMRFYRKKRNGNIVQFKQPAI